jgi:tetratricopeptide (TPR) repeat protein
MGETYLRPTVAAYLAVALAGQGRFDEAERFAEIAEELATADDVVSQALWRSVRARVLAQDARFAEAVVLADEAVDLLAATDALVKHADALLVLAGVLALAGRIEEAEDAGAEALALYDQKGNEVAARAARKALAQLAVEVAS